MIKNSTFYYSSTS